MIKHKPLTRKEAREAIRAVKKTHVSKVWIRGGKEWSKVLGSFK